MISAAACPRMRPQPSRRERVVPPARRPPASGGHLGRFRYRKDYEGVRRRVYVLEGVEGYHAQWTDACSGCTEVPECTSGPDRGIGCHECGYTGKRRWRYWFPFDEAEWESRKPSAEAQS
jgi:hypothetical protein